VDARYRSAFSDGQSLNTAAKVTFFLGLGAAAVATTFFVIDGLRTPERDAGMAFGIAPAPGGGAAGAWTWRF
jgi:hypothetical protein